MVKVVGVRFRNAGKVYFFAPGEYDVKRGTPVIVETARGVEYGTCVNDPREVTDDEVVAPLKSILRIASERDTKQAENNRIKEKEAYKTCAAKIREHNLEMKLIDAEYTFDNSKILFYFTADGRVDFRDLVKDLAGIFRTRIELRQVGVRDETKLLGGMGICGRPLCCHSYLSDFVPVSIKMAKEQNLSLNPTKISGVCGRLMCCLKNEEDVYEEQNRKLPGVGDYVTTVEGERGIVTNVNIFHETVKVLVQTGDDKELKEYKAEDIKFKKHRKRGKVELTPEELENLRALEPEDVAALGIDEAAETVSGNSDSRAENRNDHEPQRKDHQDRKGEKRDHGNRNNRHDRSRDNGKHDRNREQTQNDKNDNGVNAPSNQPAAEEGHSDNQGKSNNRNRNRYHNHNRNRNNKGNGDSNGRGGNDNAAKPE